MEKNTISHQWFAQSSSATRLLSPDGQELNESELKRLIIDAEGILRTRVGPMQVLSLMMPNCVEFAVLFMAITGLGCVAAPINPKYRIAEIEFNMRDSGSKFLIVSCGIDSSLMRDIAAKLNVHIISCSITPSKQFFVNYEINSGTQRMEYFPLAKPEDCALILYTSGTTSRPKCVPISHCNILKSLSNISNTYELSSKDRSLVVMPLFHVHGLIGALLSSWFSGGSAVVMPFSANVFWETFDKFSCTWYSAVPTMHQILLLNEVANSSSQIRGRLRFIRSCSAALAPATLKALEESYRVPVLEAYAMTEAAHQMTSNPLPPKVRKAGSVGLPQGVELMILNPEGVMGLGEVCIRGQNVTQGYLKRPEANKESFLHGKWFRTGDQGYLDADGYLFLTGRIKELINRGGEKISPLEIDAILLEHPAVAEAVSFAAPHEIYGEVVHAAVKLKFPASEQDLINFCRNRVASFKCPEQIYTSQTDLPKTATGKVQRRIVAELFLKKAKL